ncbi:hypothetical protein ABPG74_010718 [Tetrahymena malaccensis]
MIGKYQLNFLEQDLREAFHSRQKPIQKKLNFLSSFILFIIQFILSIRLAAYDKQFHLIFISTTICFISLVANIKYPELSQFLIIIQTIILNISFSLIDYQDFVFSLLENKSEIFLIGLGYGHLHCIIFQSLQNWYIRGITAFAVCIIGFFWSYSPIKLKFTYLVPLYLSTIFLVIAFYLWEKYEKENFCLLFIQNKSLADWQKIIKENIPQSMVFVTFPKKKLQNSEQASNKIPLKHKIINFFSNIIPERFKTQKSYQNTPNSELKYRIQKEQTVTKLDTNIRNSTENSNNNQINFKKLENSGLVFNFVNKKFYDQFQIKEWVDTQRKSISENNSNINFQYSFADLIHMDDFQQQKGNWICSESPLHQILFNNIFKNIIVSHPNPSQNDSKTFMDLDNTADFTQNSTDSTCTLSDYLKQYIEEKQNGEKDGLNNFITNQPSKPKIQKDENNYQNKKSFQKPLKQLSCFYRQLSPIFLLGQQQQQQQQQEMQPIENVQTSQVNNKQENLIIKGDNYDPACDDRKDYVLEDTQPRKPLSLKDKSNSIQNSLNQRSKIMTANFGLEDKQNLNTQNIMDIEQGETKILQSERRKNNSNDFKKHEISINSHINNNIDSIKKNQHEINCTSEDAQRNTEREMLLPSQSNLKSLFNHIQKSKQSEDKHQQRQVSFQNNLNENINQQKSSQLCSNPLSEKQQNGAKKVDKQEHIALNIIENAKQENGLNNNNFQKLDDQRNKNNLQQQQQDNAFFFDTQMVRCLWGDEEGILLIFNDISLKIINEKLREIERFKDKMLSTVTHDLKTPLNSIIMILENSFELGGLNKKQRKIILQNSQMLMSLINDILDYSQLRRDKFRLIIEEICLTQCILDVLDLFEIQADQKNINISAKFINLQQDYIMQDERRIKQILVNLIGNALKFTQQKGKIEILVKQKYSDCIQISVKDTGTGISEQIQKKLFQFFNTFDHSERANNRHGIGLGLAICKQLNNQLGPWHEIKLKSKVDQGSKFTFCIYTNLVEHQQVGQPYNNQISPLKSKTNYDKAPFFMSGSKQKVRDTVKLAEGQGQHVGDITFKEPQKNHISLLNSQIHTQLIPSPMSLNKLTPQPGKQSQQLLSISPYSQQNENIIEKSHKSDFNTQQELNSKSQNSPKNMIHASQEIKTDNLYKNNSKPHSREVQSNFVQRKAGNQKINSLVVLNSQQLLEQQNSTSINKYFDQKHQLILPLKRSIKRDYIILKGSRHKLLNQQRAYSLKLQNEEVNRRKKSLLFCKSQTIDARKNSKRLTQNQQSTPYQLEEQQKKNKFCSENCLLQSLSNYPNQKQQSDTNSNHQNLQSLGYQLPENIQSSKFIKIGNQTQTTLNFNNSINISDNKKIDKRNKDSCNQNYSKDNVCIQVFQNQSKFVDDEQTKRKVTKSMFIRVVPKFQDQEYNQENQQSKQELQEFSYALERRLSENFGENEELYKNQQIFKLQEINNQRQQADKQQSVQNPSKSFHDIQTAQSIPELQNQENGIFVNNLRYNNNQLSNKKSTYILNNKQQQQLEDKQQYKLDSFQNLHISLNKHSKSLNQNNTNEIKEVSQIKVYEVGHKKEDIYQKRDEQNTNAAEEWREDDEEMCEDSEEDYEEDQQVQHHNFKELTSNYKYIENNNEKQMVWVQNDRKLQVEILKTLLQDYSKVLIADDSPFNIFCLKQILTKNINLNIFVAYNGSEALNSYKQNRQQIIFMDLNMPVLDGYECLKCIRQYEEENHIEEKTKVIVISAQEYEPFFSNFDGYLSKPIKLIDMINLLQIFRQNQTNISSSQPQI